MVSLNAPQNLVREEFIIMKKSFIATAVATAMLLSTSAIYAAASDAVTVDGSVFYNYRSNTHEDPNNKDNKTGAIINFHAPISNGWSAYARVSFQGASSSNIQDFNSNVYNPNGGSGYETSIDQFGFNYTNGSTQVKIGRQDAWIGETGLFYDRTPKVGREAMVDGITYTASSAAWSYKILAVQEDINYGGSTGVSKNKIYAGHINYNFTPDFILGTTFAQYDFDKTASGIVSSNGHDYNKNFNTWAINTSYNFGSANVFAEYGKTNLSTDNIAYDLGIGYKFDDKNSVSATYFKVENLADMNHNTTFDSNAKGMYYSYTHNFSKTINVNLFYDDAKHLDTNQNYTSFRTTINYNF